MIKTRSFVVLVREGLKAGSLSLRGICRASGIDPSYLSKVLQGKRSPPTDEKALTRLARILDVDPFILIISTGTIPSAMQSAMERPEFIQRVFAGKEKRGRKDQRPSFHAPAPARRPALQAVKSPPLSVDLL